MSGYGYVYAYVHLSRAPALAWLCRPCCGAWTGSCQRMRGRRASSRWALAGSVGAHSRAQRGPKGAQRGPARILRDPTETPRDPLGPQPEYYHIHHLRIPMDS